MQSYYTVGVVAYIPSGWSKDYVVLSPGYLWSGESLAMSSGGQASVVTGPPGQDGRSVQVFVQAGEPVSAVTGDIWIVP